MNNQRVISTKQISRLLLGYTMGASLLILPSEIARVFGPAAWLATLVYGLVIVLGAWLTARLVEKFPDETVAEFGPRLLGRIPGFFFGICLSLYFLGMVPYQTRAMVELTSIAIMPFGPGWFIAGLFLLAVVYGVIKGLDTFVQLNELLLGISLAIGILVVLLGWQNMKPVHLLPLFFSRDLHLKNPLDLLALFAAFIGYPILFYISPFLRRPGRMTGYTVRTLIFLTLVYSFFVLTVTGVFGAKESGRQGWSVLELAKSIHFPGVMLERMDLIMLLSWIPAIYTTTAGSLFFGAEGLRRMFKIRKTSPLVWALAVVFFFFSVNITNYFQWMFWGRCLSYIGVLIGFILPLFLWSAYLARPDKPAKGNPLKGAKGGA